LKPRLKQQSEHRPITLGAARPGGDKVAGHNRLFNLLPLVLLLLLLGARLLVARVEAPLRIRQHRKAAIRLSKDHAVH
jgi:hypothetical protein